MDVEPRGANGAQRRELVDVVFGARIECLSDDDGADDHSEQRASEQREASAGAEQPEGAAAVAKLRGREDVDVGKFRRETTAHALHVGTRSDAHQKIRDLIRWRAGEGAPAIERCKDVRRGGE